VNSEVPETSVATIKQADKAADVFTLLCSGWSPFKISRYLHKTEGLIIPPADIKEFMTEIPPAFFLPPSYIRKKLLKLDVRIDAMGDLARLIRIGEERLSAALLAEEQNPEALNAKVSRMVKQQFEMLVKFAELQTKVGDLPTEPVRLDATLRFKEKPPTLGEILKGARFHEEPPESTTGDT